MRLALGELLAGDAADKPGVAGAPQPFWSKQHMANVVEAYDVIVVGAGPVGLTLAIDLGRRCVRCLLIERNPTTAPWPKMDRSNSRWNFSPYRHVASVQYLPVFR